MDEALTGLANEQTVESFMINGGKPFLADIYETLRGNHHSSLYWIISLSFLFVFVQWSGTVRS